MKSLFVSMLVLCAIAAPHVVVDAAGQTQNARVQAPGISAQAAAQISALVAEKRTRTPVQRKIDSQLHYGARIASGRAIAAGVASLRVRLPMTPDNRAVIDVRATVTDGLLDRLRGLGAEVTGTNARYRHVAVRAPLDLVEAIAAIAEVESVAPDFGYMTSRGVTPMLRTIAAPPLPGVAGRSARNRSELGAALRDKLQPRGARVGQSGGAITNGGSVISEGVRTHRADEAQGTFGVTGAGVKIGVISDGVRTLGNSQARGDVGPVTIIGPAAPCGTASLCDEGTAMLEIVADLAPGGQLYFASANGGTATFAQRIRDLRAAGCDIIVDDVFYFVESVFQDGQTVPSDLNGGIIAQAVKDVAASGALYFSAAGNSGRLSAGTSGTWEGDFVDGGPATAPLPLDAGDLHNSGSAAAPERFDTIVSAGGAFSTLAWAEPLGGAASDYDIYLLDNSGNTVLAAGTNFQNGSQDPFELVDGGADGDRLVIALFSGRGRFLHLDTNGGRLAVATAGEIHGHAATSAPNTFGVAATPACGGAGSTGPCTTSFSSANKVENFSSGGPRRIFFTSGGAAITPGNFSSTGGQVLQKPDLAAADGVSTSVPGFSPFFGTSAAAPHAAALAARVKARNLAQSAASVSSALISTAIDLNTPGWDRDAGFGIVMAFQAAEAAPGPPAPPTGLRLRRIGPSSALASWNAVTGATSYTLRMGTVAHGPKTPVATVTGTSVVVAGLVREQTYYFTLAAQNGAGASPDSVEIAFGIAGVDGANEFDGLTSASGYSSQFQRPWGVSGDIPIPPKS